MVPFLPTGRYGSCDSLWGFASVLAISRKYQLIYSIFSPQSSPHGSTFGLAQSKLGYIDSARNDPRFLLVGEDPTIFSPDPMAPGQSCDGQTLQPSYN